jgi:hypothetical protein
MVYSGGSGFVGQSIVTQQNVGVSNGAGTARIVNGIVEVLQADGSWLAAAASQQSQYVTGNGIPQTAPARPAEDAVFESLDLNVFFRWDTDTRLWRSTGQVKELLVLASLQASTWTRMPQATILTSIDDWLLFRADGSAITTIDHRRASDGWPELNSLNAYSNVQIRAFGESVFTPI